MLSAFAATSVLCITLGSCWIWSLHNVGDLLTKTATRTAKKLELAGIIVADAAKLRSAQRGVIMYTSAGAADRVDTNRKLFLTVDREIRQTLAEMRPLLDSEAMESTAGSIADAESKYLEAFDVIAKDCANGDTTAALAAAKSAGGFGDQMEKGAKTIAQAQRELLASSVVHSQQVQSRSQWLALALSMLCALAGAAVLWAVQRINTTLEQVSARLRESSHQIAGDATQVAASSQALAGSAAQQAASVQEMSAAGHEISAMTDATAERSATAAALMIEVSKHIVQSEEAVDEMRASMAEIKTVNEKISGITKLVEGIAFQTNILALNAAVESARAGEAGMGFAVVADEVRALAQRSADAAKTTAELIGASLFASASGIAKLEQVTKTIGEIEARASKAGSLFAEVRSGADHQRLGIQQISSAMSQLSQSTQTNAAQSEEEAAASEELSSQLRNLNQAIVCLSNLIGATK